MKIVVLLAQILLAISAAGYGFWLFQWHRAHPQAAVVVASAPGADAPPAPPSPQKVRQNLVEQWIKGNLSDPAAKIVHWTQVIPVEDRECVMVTIQGKTRSGKQITRTYVFEFREGSLLSTTSGTSFLESLLGEAKSAPTSEQEKRLKEAYAHLKKAFDQLATGDSPTS